MLSDEEKKAIKDCDIIFITLEDMMSEESANDYRKSYNILKNLIEKQSKEIEELREKNKNLNWYFENQKENFIHKAKIKAKIEECREILYSFEKELELKANKDKFIHKESMNCLLGQISVLQSLLEEKE